MCLLYVYKTYFKIYWHFFIVNKFNKLGCVCLTWTFFFQLEKFTTSARVCTDFLNMEGFLECGGLS